MRPRSENNSWLCLPTAKHFGSCHEACDSVPRLLVWVVLWPRLPADPQPSRQCTAGANKPAIAQLVEHLTVECCSNQMVPGSIPGGRIYRTLAYRANQCAPLPTSLHITSNRVVFVDAGYKRAGQFYQWVM